jgi:hypothetical protein
MVSRRAFLQTSAVYGAAAAVYADTSKPTGFFGVHPFVDQHPEAVFILRTHVDRKTNSEACKRAGLDFGRSVFVPMDAGGTPVTHNIACKPNLTAHQAVDERRGFTLEDTMGITTDAFFVEGLFESLKDLGVPGSKLHMRDANGSGVVEPRGYVAMSRRVGGAVTPVKARMETAEDANDQHAFLWKEVPGGVVHTQIPYFWPFNAGDSWNLNVAKFKAHAMGLTLAAKNWQGAHPNPFQTYCRKWPGIEAIQKVEGALKKECVPGNVRDVIEASLERHASIIPRWNTPEFPRTDPGYIRLYNYDPLCMELWAHRTIDNHAASPMGLHIVEGIYGRDGDFNLGPNPLGSENSKDPWLKAPTRTGRAWDYLSNFVLFGKNPYLVDIVGHWLGGHEPGNFGLFHIAKERGKLKMLNPMSIPVYEWQDGVAVRRPLTGFTRTPLRTSYLQQHHKNEPLWHLVDEPFDYSKANDEKLAIPAKPTSRPLNRHYPDSGNSRLAIEFSVPETGWALVEILDAGGNTLEVISSSICEPGYHMAAWDTAKYASGAYQYRLRYRDTLETHDLELKKG